MLTHLKASALRHAKREGSFIEVGAFEDRRGLVPVDLEDQVKRTPALADKHFQERYLFDCGFQRWTQASESTESTLTHGRSVLRVSL